MQCFTDYCNLEIVSCVLNFLILISNSVSMSMSLINLNSSHMVEMVITIVSLSTSIICVSIKQSSHIEEKIKNKKIRDYISNEKMFIDC